MKKIIYTRPDGGLTVCGPFEGARLAVQVILADGTVLKPEGDLPAQPVDRFLRRWPVAGALVTWAETEEQFLARVMAKAVPADAQNVAIVVESAIPSDRAFRNAWESAGGGVTVNMPKARELHRQKMRDVRKPKLDALDVEQLRGRDVEAQKQVLRDVTGLPEIDAAVTPDALKAVWPDCLK